MSDKMETYFNMYLLQNSMKLFSQKQWKKLDTALSRTLPIVLVLLFVYLYLSLIDNSVSSVYKNVLKYIIIGFFVLELIVKYQFYESRKKFIKSKWLDILLIVPFFKVFKLFKLAGLVGKLFKSLKFLPYIQKGLKVPKILRKLKNKK